MGKLFKLAVASIDRPESGDAPGVIDDCIAAIAAAGERGADLLVLPEEPDIIAGGAYGQYPLAQHPVFLRMAEQAARSRVGIVSSLSVALNGGNANTGFLLDRDGRLTGVYRKKHPAPSEEEILTDPTDGDPFPVFDFEGVKLGIAICMDIHAPEMFRIYGLKGADLVCVPTMYLDYTGDMLESLEKARAIDSQMYLALSRYITRPFLAGKSMGYAKVVAPDGRIVASTAHRPGVVVAEIDPAWRMPFWGEGYEGNMRFMFDVIRRPDFYGALVEPKSVTQAEGSKRQSDTGKIGK
jgi:predicted amidohydrolase